MLKDQHVEPLFNQELIASRVNEIAESISRDHQNKETVLVCVLKGAFLFAADLCRQISIPVGVDFIIASSYLGTSSTGEVKISAGHPFDYSDKNVILIEDIVDTGLTIKKLMEVFLERGAAQVKVATLLSKKAHRKHQVNVDYCGFEIDDHFVVGYGLDYNQKYRDLPYIGKYNGPISD